jgi:hypothetical protein
MSHIILFIFPNEAHLDHDGSKVMGKSLEKSSEKSLENIKNQSSQPPPVGKIYVAAVIIMVIRCVCVLKNENGYRL